MSVTDGPPTMIIQFNTLTLHLLKKIKIYFLSYLYLKGQKTIIKNKAVKLLLN